ncbi:MAG TPA: peptidoglycan bridge formation glycyltransferase FemA/FemB family protein [Actinomycetota bacterium]|nr:peptidoglycan bridge formation glycyltransferase FemA/FemB family protein [Actinomycetota bacterium]
MDVRKAGPSERDAFNGFVSAMPSGDLLQSWEWGEIKRASGWAPARYLVMDGGRIVAAASVLRTRPLKGAPPLLYAPRGPVFRPEAAGAVRALAEQIRRDAGSAFVLKCDPAIEAGSAEAGALREAGFRPAGGAGFGGVQPKAVMVLDIGRDEDAILEGFKSKWRYNIRLAERKGVTVEQAGREDLPAFYDLLLITAKRDGFFVRGRAYFETLFDTLEPRDMLSLWLARYEAAPVAGAICFAFGNRVTYVYGASSNEHRKVMPNHLMQWTMIQWARKRGATLYDFRGVSPVRDGKPVEEHIAGLNRFKEGFGARYVEYTGDLDLPLRPLVWRAWVAGAPAAMKLYKKIKGGAGAAAD